MNIKNVTRPQVNLKANAGSTVVLSITIGNGQIGGNVVSLNGQPLAKGTISNLSLGLGSALAGKVLTIVTNVLDVNPATNKIAITHFFYNAEPAVQTQLDTVDEDGDVYSLTATYQFS